MGLLTLYAGLILPWLGGALWLMSIEARLDTSRISRIRQVGYGFFVGYAILFLAIVASQKLFDSVSWPYLMGFLAIIAASGGVTVWRSRTTAGDLPHGTKASVSLPIKALVGVLLVLTAVHLLFITMEVFTRPVYPWDAWLAWVYRAKAWFMAGNMVEVVNPAGWAVASSTDVYTIDAWRYPLFPSVIPYWAALSLGRWSETLVNVPVLFAGLALGMALYGQCREYGLDKFFSLVTCYLLFSIPLLGTHLALAGYADIWMAGFTGLGFVALMRGAMKHGDARTSGYQLMLGLLMIVFSIAVKNEGAVWFIAALFLLVPAMYRPRVPVAIVVAVVLITTLGYALGHPYIDLPLIGRLGFEDGRLAIPFIGSFKLGVHDVRLVYWKNFISLGSWNLLWVAIAASLLLGLRPSNAQEASRAKRVTLSFILIFVATQAFIFGFTDQGLWADTYTAINRLPLHFVPALLFSAVIVLNAALPQTTRRSGASPRFLPAFTAVLLAATIVFAGAVGFLSRDLPDQPGQKLDHPATDFSFAFGSGYPSDGRMLVDGFANGYALLSSGPVSITASSKRILSYTWLPPEPSMEAAFFWRLSDDARNVQRTEITLPGTHLIDLETESDWRGEVIEFGFLVAGNNGDTIEIGNTSLIHDSLSSRLMLTWHAWTSFEGWTQKSINFLYGGDYRQLLSLPLLVTFWLLTALFLFWLLTRFRTDFSGRQFLNFAGLLFLTGWVLLDIRWSANSVRQVQLSSQSQWQAIAEDRPGTEPDGALYDYVQRLKSEILGEQPARILVLGDENSDEYYLLRAKYHLLPHSVVVSSGFPRGVKSESLDYVLFIGPPGGIRRTPGWNPAWRDNLSTVDSDEWGTVYRVR